MGVFCLILVGIAGSAFFENSIAQEENTGGDPVVRIADLPIVNALPFYIALEKGYFKEAGVNAEHIKIDSPNLIIDAMLAGQADFTSTSGALAIAGIADTKKPGALKIFAAAGGNPEVPSDVLVVKKDSSLQAVSDLKGKKLGILPGIHWRTTGRHLVRQFGLDPDKDIEIIDIAPALQVPALASGQVDALLTVEPALAIAQVKGVGRELVHGPALQTIGNPFYPGAGIVRTEFAEQYPEVTEKVLAVFERAVKDMREDPEEARPYLLGYTALDESVIPAAPVPVVRMASELSESELDAVQKYYDIFWSEKVVDQPMSFRNMLYR